MAEKSYLDSVGDYLKTLNAQGLAVRFGVVFGSWAKGNPGQWSDIDLMVVSPRFDGPRNRRDLDLLWRLAARIDSRIEPVPCGEKQWEEDDSSAIVEIARREGKRVDLFRNIRNRVSELPGYEKFETDHKMREIEISEEPIELYKILKLENMVASGGEAKHVISEGHVLVNGKVEIRKRKKIFSGDVIEFGKNKLRIKIKRE